MISPFEIDILLPSCTPQELHNSVVTQWALPPEYSCALDRYYLLNWDASYFWNQAHPLTHQGIKYSVMCARGVSIKQISQTKRIALSFRKLFSMPTGYVLIRGITS